MFTLIQLTAFVRTKHCREPRRHQCRRHMFLFMSMHSTVSLHPETQQSSIRIQTILEQELKMGNAHIWLISVLVNTPDTLMSCAYCTLGRASALSRGRTCAVAPLLWHLFVGSLVSPSEHRPHSQQNPCLNNHKTQTLNENQDLFASIYSICIPCTVRAYKRHHRSFTNTGKTQRRSTASE